MNADKRLIQHGRYDHVQILMPHMRVRDEFLNRLMKMEGEEQTPWNGQVVQDRVSWTNGGTQQTYPTRTVESETVEQVVEEPQKLDNDEKKLLDLIKSESISEAFFLARRLVASGEEWAVEYLEQCRSQM